MSDLSVHISGQVYSRDREDGLWLTVTQSIENLSFSSALPGGFQTADITLSAPGYQAEWWYQIMLSADIQILEAGEIIWEGRVNTIKFGRQTVYLGCMGYWIALTDLINYGFWTAYGAEGWKLATPDLHVIASDANFEKEGFDVSTEGALVVYAEGALSQNKFVSAIWTKFPDISGANTPQVAPRGIHRIKGHIEAAGGIETLNDFYLYVTDNPYIDALGSWTLIKSWTGGGAIDEDFDINVSYGVDSYAVMFLVKYTSATPQGGTPGVFIVLTDLELRATRSDDDSGIISAKKILKTLIAGDSNLGFSSPEHLVLSTETLYIEDPANEILPYSVENKNVQEIATQLGLYGDNSANPKEWSPAVWGRKRFHFAPKNTDVLHWIVSKYGLSDEGAEFERSLENFWAEVYAVHKGLKGRDRWTTVKDDAINKEVMPLYRRLQFTTNVVQAAVADKIRDAQYDYSKLPPQQASITISGHIMNSAGVLCPLWRVRAGDFLQIRDLTPSYCESAIDATDISNPLRTFYIRETKYDLTNNELTITPDFPASRLDVLIARLTELS